MNSNDVDNLERMLPLADKYGLAYITALVLLIIVITLVRSIIKGNLVTRELLDRAEEERDRLQAILDKERAEFMAPTLEGLRRHEMDHNLSNRE